MALFSLLVSCRGIGAFASQCQAPSPYEAVRIFLRGPSLNHFLAEHSGWPKDFHLRDIYAFYPLVDLAQLYFCGLGQEGRYVDIHVAQTVRHAGAQARYCGPQRRSVVLR